MHFDGICLIMKGTYLETLDSQMVGRAASLALASRYGRRREIIAKPNATSGLYDAQVLSSIPSPTPRSIFNAHPLLHFRTWGGYPTRLPSFMQAPIVQSKSCRNICLRKRVSCMNMGNLQHTIQVRQRELYRTGEMRKRCLIGKSGYVASRMLPQV
jgi:hypothetical protein